MCSQTPPAAVDLGADGRAASKARHFLRKSLCAHCANAVDTAELLVSELVSNALCHAKSSVSLRIECKRGKALEVHVRDASRKAPVQERAGVWDESGRGVDLVDQLSDAWGTKRLLRGKVVWFRLNC